jgi:hypothetical protein
MFAYFVGLGYTGGPEFFSRYCFYMDTFDIDIRHEGNVRTFHGTFGKYGYSYRFIIDIEGVAVIFEPDEERNLRAIVPPASQHDANIKQLVTLLGNELQKHLFS